MHLHNFNNIKDLTYEIDNKKINFLFGISGSGKSSISKSFNATALDSYLTIGSPLGSCSVTIEDKEFGDDEAVPIYDYDYMNKVLIQKSEQNDIYSILFDGEETLSSYRLSYAACLGDFCSYKSQLIETKNKIHALISVLKIDFNKNGTYKSGCLIR